MMYINCDGVDLPSSSRSRYFVNIVFIYRFRFSSCRIQTDFMKPIFLVHYPKHIHDSALELVYNILNSQAVVADAFKSPLIFFLVACLPPQCLSRVS